MFSVALIKTPSLGSISPVRCDRMGVMVLMFSPDFMFSFLSVYMGREGGFPAKHQEFEVQWPACGTEPDWIHCPVICAGDPANRQSPACASAIGTDKDHFE